MEERLRACCVSSNSSITYFNDVTLRVGRHISVSELYNHVLDTLRKLSLCGLVDTQVAGLEEYQSLVREEFTILLDADSHPVIVLRS